MKSYGQFCSIARALDLLGERWTLLVVRELLCGSQRFGELKRGLPRISRTMLSARLTELRDAGVITRHEDEDGPTYALTAAGADLLPVVLAVGTWGQRHLPRHLAGDTLDADFLLWDMRRRVNVEALPARPVLVTVELTDLPEGANLRYLLLRRTEVSLCTTNPGFEEGLRLRSSRATLVAWWRGDLPFAAARHAGLVLLGPRALVKAFATWFGRYLLADVERRSGTAPPEGSKLRGPAGGRPAARAPNMP